MTKHLLITGGAGFIGANFIELLLQSSTYHITNFDALTYASEIENITCFSNHANYRFIKGDISDQKSLEQALDCNYDAIINFAAESHVDKSIESAYPFIHTNVIGTHHLLNAVLSGKAKKMIQISTDEVYGSLQADAPSFTEETKLAPNNPYAASKASADLLVRSFYHTHKLPLIITRCSNNYGPRQNEEKFIPKVILSALCNQSIPIYGDGLQIRDWIFVKDHCKAIKTVLEQGIPGEIYNIGGNDERTNLEVAIRILDYLQKDHGLLKHVIDRKGHDRRYSVSTEKMKIEFGWEPSISFSKGLVETIEWYKQRWNY